MTRLALALSLAAAIAIANASQTPLGVGIDLEKYECSHPPYKSHIVSKSPLLIYLSDFVTPEERAHLQEISYVSGEVPRRSSPEKAPRRRFSD